jgi:glycosyltransferase involved in cell wall biosynthesis
MATASLVITTYNWKDALALCLRSVAAQQILPVDVVVADDGSREDTGALVRAMARDFPTRLVHAWQEDAGFRAARVRNLGTAATRGDYVVFLDGDMLLHPAFVADHLALARPGAYLQGGRLNTSRAEAERLLAGGAPRFSPWMPLADDLRGELKREHALRLPWLAQRRAQAARGGTVMSCNMGVWRADLERVNGFDEAYEGWGREDDDLAARLSHAGVARRALRWAGLALHLWHPTRRPPGFDPHSPERSTPNDARLEAVRRARTVRCERGLADHMPTEPAALLATAAA